MKRRTAQHEMVYYITPKGRYAYAHNLKQIYQKQGYLTKKNIDGLTIGTHIAFGFLTTNKKERWLPDGFF